MRYLIILLVVFVCCNCGGNKSQTVKFVPHTDTLKTLAVFINSLNDTNYIPGDDIKWGIVYRLSTERAVVDSFLHTKIFKDTASFVPTFDSLGTHVMIWPMAICYD